MTASAGKILTTTAVLAVSALAALPAMAQSTDDSAAQVVTAQGELRDLVPATEGPLDGARAVFVMVSRDGQSMARLQVSGVDRDAAGRTFGAHLHVGPCVEGNGAAAGPHYNSDTAAGQVPPRVDATTEIWLDFTVTPGGTGYASTTVPFIPLPGDRSVVIHQEPTDPNGAAGPRLACLPVSW
ncbi:Cu/Zn superoxide dismutase [Kribbella antiqua]|uniref:Cu/Zn superoxide dismutase n=1 Tax=Kribbella antiqua TaxID=2512217 RepID=A0A4R2IF58_9ACTN|nr:superoxide dismutase family protein [Kribbella antiqua]TCO42278.1 Cu/Zn superoxide dismutase [Kribbella antiqua]